MNTFGCQHLSGKLQAGQNIVSLQIRKLGQHLLYGISPGQIFENTFHGVPQASNAGLPVTDFRIDSNT